MAMLVLHTAAAWAFVIAANGWISLPVFLFNENYFSFLIVAHVTMLPDS